MAAEGVGTAMLLAAVVGSGIMGERLAGGNMAVALLANSIATGAALLAIITTFGGVSGAHLNPLVTVADACLGCRPWREVPGYLISQFIGALAGVAAANAMFDEPPISPSTHARAGFSLMFAESIATFGLLLVIHGCSRFARPHLPFAVAGYITAAYWFTSSTSFANPAVTFARTATNTFAGIRAADAPGFVAAQLAGGAAAVVLIRWLFGVPAGAAKTIDNS
ncbi:MAG: aquaporin [Planctomycetes bacterium]|nr:aquaporin [Planctomycetota bacterium]